MAAKSLCEWMHAVINFSEIIKETRIKKKNVKQMDEELAISTNQLKAKQAELDKITEKRTILERRYFLAKEENEQLEFQIKQAEDRIQRAT